jgi:DNA-directed RNA polymerase subunit N (RpoN/RPB10)
MNSCVACTCGNEIGKYYHLFTKAKKEGKLEELFNKLQLTLCCRVAITAFTELPDYLTVKTLN